MLTNEIKQNLNKLCEKHGGSVIFDHPLSPHSTISIGGKAAAWYVPSSLDELKAAKLFLDQSDIKTIVMGLGSNLLIPDEGLDVVVMSLSNDFFRETKFEGRTVTIGAGARLEKFISDCCGNALSGFEGLVGIPATIGGALKNNASYQTTISEYLLRVLVLTAEGKETWISKKDLKFRYRYSSFRQEEVILRAVFYFNEESPASIKTRVKQYFAEKIKKQPLKEKTLGCVFKNPAKFEYASGELIDKAGLKGYARGAAQVSLKHANFIVNTGGATSKDVTGLIKDIQEKVRKKFSIELEPEIEIL